MDFYGVVNTVASNEKICLINGSVSFMKGMRKKMSTDSLIVALVLHFITRLGFPKHVQYIEFSL